MVNFKTIINPEEFIVFIEHTKLLAQDYSLSQQLSMFDKNDKFFWIDDCFKINHVFTYTMDKFYGLCLAYGSLAGKVDTFSSKRTVC
jgi:hypothetical protein